MNQTSRHRYRIVILLLGFIALLGESMMSRALPGPGLQGAVGELSSIASSFCGAGRPSTAAVPEAYSGLVERGSAPVTRHLHCTWCGILHAGLHPGATPRVIAHTLARAEAPGAAALRAAPIVRLVRLPERRGPPQL